VKFKLFSLLRIVDNSKTSITYYFGAMPTHIGAIYTTFCSKSLLWNACL